MISIMRLRAPAINSRRPSSATSTPLSTLSGLATRRHMSNSAASVSDPFPQGKSGKIIVYGRHTTRVQKVLFALEELNLPYESVILPSPPPEYFKNINPMGLIPAIRDESIKLDGSNAICVYLAKKYGTESDFYPADIESLSKCIQWSEFAEWYLATPRLNVVYHGIVNKQYPPSFKKPGCPCDEELEGFIDATASALGVLNNHLAEQKNGGFIAHPGNISFADAAAAPWIHKWYEFAASGQYGPKLSLKNFEALTKYYDKISSRPSFENAIRGK